MPHPVLVMDGEDRLILANGALWREVGADPARFPAGTPLRDILSLLAFRGLLGPGDPAALAAEALAQDRSTARVWHKCSADGARLAEVTTLPLPGGGFVLCSIDITTLQRAEGHARATAALLERVLGAQRGGVALFDKAQRLVLHNPAYRRHSGATPELLAGHPTLREIMEGLAKAGEFLTSEGREHFATGVSADRRKPRVAERERADGLIVRFASSPQSDGGFLIEADDVTELRRTEDEARRRAALIDGVLEALPHGICVWTHDRRVARFNTAYVRLMEGAPLWVGDTLQDVIRRRAEACEYGPGEAAEVYAREIARDTSRPQERRRLRPNGTTLDVRTAPLPDGGHVSVITDITAVWRAEEEARRRAAVLETAMASMRHGLIVYGPDRKVITANALAGALAGHEPGEIRPGRSVDDLVTLLHVTGRLGPDGDRLARAALELDRSKPYRGVRKTPEGRVLEVSSDPTPDGGFVVTHVDITALATAQAEAERRAGILQVMLDNIRHGICLFDAEGRVVMANALAAAMTGLQPEAFRPGRTVFELRQDQIRAGEYVSNRDMEVVLGERLADPLRAPDRYIRRRANGLIVEVTTDRTPDGGYVRTYSDVTEDWRIRDELESARIAAEAASQAKSRFLATMSHELRTPLSAVIGFAETLLADPAPEQVAEYAEAVRDAGRQLLSLIEDILDVARAAGPQDAAARMPVDVVALAASLREAMRSAATEAHLTLDVEATPDLPHAVCDERRLRRILLALLDNAVKFTPPGGRASITVTPEEGGGLAFRITDTGIGMPPEQIPRAFEPFTQLESSHARRFAGSGLGLHLSQVLAEAMGATLNLESAPGHGTTATLRLPPGITISPTAATQETT
nr:PAS domain-containing sensor histidine kinase [Neoroseomonas soli]